MPYKDKNRQRAALDKSGRSISFRIVYSSDQDIADWVKKQKNVSAAIKAAIRKEMSQE